MKKKPQKSSLMISEFADIDKIRMVMYNFSKFIVG